MSRQLMAWIGFLASSVQLLSVSTYAAVSETNSTYTLNTVIELSLIHI